jgi:photosystem II stability/assembly factor-like uncharacterized protein
MKTTTKWIFFALTLVCFSPSFGQTRSYLKMMEDMSINFYTVCDSAEAYFSVNGKGKGSGYTPYLRWKYLNESMYYPSGDRTIDHLAPYMAYQELKKAPHTRLFQDGGWRSLGPDSITNITGHYAAGLGRLDLVLVNHSNPQQMYVASRSGGLWRTNDDGDTWQQHTDFVGSTGIYTASASPLNFDSILVNVSIPNIAQSLGIYRSTDGGVTFSPTAFTPQALGVSSIDVFVIKYHPRVPNLVFVGTNRGIFRSTDNLQTWTQLNPTWDVRDIEFHPTDNSIIYVSDYYYWAFASNPNTIYKSTNQGLSYQATPVLVGNNGEYVNISVSNDCPNCVYLASKNGTWKSFNEGESFEAIPVTSNPPNTPEDQPFNQGESVPNDQDTSVFITGHVNVYRSINGGRHFDKCADWHLGEALNGNGTLWQNFQSSTSYVHADVRYLECIDGIFYVCTDGYMARSADNGITWQRLTNNIGIRENYCAGTAQSDHNTTLLGSQDNGTTLIDNNGWTEVYGADGMEAIIHPLNEQFSIFSIQNGNRRRSIDGGLSSELIFDPNPVPGLDDSDSAEWVAPLLTDPNDHFTLYHFGLRTYKSTDFGNTWTVLGAPSTFSGKIMKAAIAENNSQLIVIARLDFIELSTDGGITYSTIKNNLPNNWITDIAFDPNNDSTIIITYDWSTTGRWIMMTNDLGQTWTNITYNLDGLPIQTVAIDHTDNATIYLGGRIGFYKKTMNATNWELYDENLPNCMVRDLEINYGSNTLKAATYGRGLWEYTLAGRANYPAILTTEINNDVSWTSPKETIEQFVTSTISYESTITSAFVKWSLNNNTLNNNILMTNISDSTWRAVSSLPTGMVGDKVFFKVFAVGENNDTTETYKFMYQIKPYVYCDGVGGTLANWSFFIQNYSCSNVLNNNSGDTETNYFANLPVFLWKDSSYTATANFNNTWGLNDLTIWIDYNNNTDFESNELVVLDLNTGSTGTGQFTVPNTVTDDTVKMRVRLSYWDEVDPCTTTAGEIEDYPVYLRSVPNLAFSGNTSFCLGQLVNLNYSGTFTDSLNWVISDGVANYPYTGNSISTNVLALGSYSVILNGYKYGMLFSDTVANAFSIYNSPVVNAGTDITVCQGESITVNASGASQYVWNAPFTVPNGLPFTPPVGTHTLSVTGTDTNGCSDQDTLQLIIMSSPTAAATINNSSILESNTASTYQWIDCSNETTIAEATNQLFTPSANGVYAVVVTNNSACIDTSDCVTYSLVGINDLPDGMVAIYPNPSHDFVMLSVTKEMIGEEIEITGTMGELVYTTTILQQEQKIDLSTYASGIYYLAFKKDATTKKHKLIRL